RALPIRGRADELAIDADLPAHRAGPLLARDQLLALERDDEVTTDPDARAYVRIDLPHRRARAEVVGDDRARRAALDDERARLARRVARDRLLRQLAPRERGRERGTIVVGVRGGQRVHAGRLARDQRDRDGGDGERSERESSERVHLP